MADRERLLRELYEAHALSAARLAYVLTGTRETAEDLVQEAFIRTFDRLELLREQRAFPGYLRVTIVNLARAHFRRLRIERLSLRRQATLDRTPGGEPPRIDERDRLWRALQGLPYRQRAALVLRYYEDLSERDTAELLGITLPALKGLVARGTKALRADLEGTKGEPTP
ncbi:MAG TPA: sigma-70 family RNA polymerase sigma factor [Actinomycetota bacterium]